jgi:hypothetical protein
VLVYDRMAHLLILAGGYHGRTILNDTWAFTGGDWTNLASSAGTAPSITTNGIDTYDLKTGDVLIRSGTTSRLLYQRAPVQPLPCMAGEKGTPTVVPSIQSSCFAI